MTKRDAPNPMHEFLSRLEASETTLADWARANSLPVRAVYSVVSGHHTGSRGTARQVLKAMGIKPPPLFANSTRRDQWKAERRSALVVRRDAAPQSSGRAPALTV